MREVEFGVTFSNSAIRVSPQRSLRVADPEEKPPWDLVKLTFEEFRSHMRGHLMRGVPRVLRDNRVLQAWVDSQGESLYNPLFVYEDGRFFKVFDGVHRLRSLTALGSSHIWVYLSRGVRFQSTVYPYRSHNFRLPRRGGRIGSCSQCGDRVRMRKFGLGGWRVYQCKGCGHRAKFIAYPRSVNQIVVDGEVVLEEG